MYQLVLVGDNHHRDVDLVDGLKQLHDVHGHLGVDVAGGLIGNDELGAVGQGAGYCHTLLFTAGKFVRQAVHLILQTDQGQNIWDAGFDLFGRNVGHAHGESHILVHCHGGDQAEILEDDTHLAAQIRHLAAFHLGKVLTVDDDAALGGLFFHLDQFEEGGFARTGMAKDKDELAVLDLDIDVIERYVFVVVRLVSF